MDFSSMPNTSTQGQPPPSAPAAPDGAPPPPAAPNAMSFDFLDSTGAGTPSYSFENSPMLPEELGGFPAFEGGEQQLSGGQLAEDTLREAAEHAANAALFSGLGGAFDAQGLEGMGAFLDPSLGGFPSPLLHLDGLDPAPVATPSFVGEQYGSGIPDARGNTGATGSFAQGLLCDSEDEGPGGLGMARVDSTGGDEEMEVDIMGGGDEGATIDALKAQSLLSNPASSTSKPRNKPSSKPKPRYFASGGTSPAPSPGPSSGLANEVFPSSTSTSASVSSASSSSAATLRTVPTAPLASIDPAFHHTGPPSSFIHPRLRAPLAPLPAAFETYRPPKGGRPTNDDSEDEEEERARKERTRKAAVAARRGKRRGRDEDEYEDGEGQGEDGEKDARRYCVCEELYQPERLMIACDKCEEWYHVDCVGIAEDAVELVDLFICPKCQADSLDRTTWKSPCKRPHCRNPAVPLSKYCSDYCGILVASSRLSLLQNATSVPPESFYPAVRSATRKEAAVTDQAVDGADARVLLSMDQRRAKQAAEWAREDAASDRTRSRLAEKLEDTETRAAGLKDAIRTVEKKLLYLQKVAIKRWEALCQATADEMAAAGMDVAAAIAAGAGRRRGSKKKKGPMAATSLPDAQCGLDVRLVYDDTTWSAWVEEEGENGGRRLLEAARNGDEEEVKRLALETLGGVCLETRKRCERHQGWQKVREADFAVEKAVLERRLNRLATVSTALVDQLTSHDHSTSYRRSARSRTCDPDRLIDVEDYIQEREAARPKRGGEERRGSGGGGGGRGGSPSPELGVAGRGGRRGRDESVELGMYGGGGGGGGKDSGEYEIPAELLPYLSRAEIAQMKRNRGKM